MIWYVITYYHQYKIISYYCRMPCASSIRGSDCDFTNKTYIYIYVFICNISLYIDIYIYIYIYNVYTHVYVHMYMYVSIISNQTLNFKTSSISTPLARLRLCVWITYSICISENAVGESVVKATYGSCCTSTSHGAHSCRDAVRRGEMCYHAVLRDPRWRSTVSYLVRR